MQLGTNLKNVTLCCLIAVRAHTVETGWCLCNVIIAQVKIEGIFQIDFKFQEVNFGGLYNALELSFMWNLVCINTHSCGNQCM